MGKTERESDRLKIEKIALFAGRSPASSVSVTAAKRLVQDLRASGFTVLENRDEFNPQEVDLVILLGGDGFLMDSIRSLNFPPTPIFGINFGSVGFLMNPRISMDDLVSIIREGRFRAEDHPVLEAKVQVVDGSEKSILAVNDFVMERKGGQSVRLRILAGGILFNEFSGDGVIVATSTGSTAYNLAAGGPVFHPEIGAIVITPLYPHRATPFHSLQFSVLLPLYSDLEVVGVDIDKRPIRLVADGCPVEGPARIQVRDSGLRLHLLRVESHEFISDLAQKFIGPL